MSSKLTNVLMVIALSMISLATFAQGIKGTVRDTTGTGVPGAAVSVEGRVTGVITDGNGGYTLRIEPGTYRLKISSIGFETRTAAVTVQGTDFAAQDVILRDASSTLQEIVVVGSRSNVARTNIETPVPVDVIGAKEIKAYAQTDVTQILNFIAPSFSSNRQTVADGTDHIDPASLRGLGPDSKPCRNIRSRLPGRNTRSKSRFSYLPPKTRLSRKAPTRYPKPNWTGSCSTSNSTIRPTARKWKS